MSEADRRIGGHLRAARLKRGLTLEDWARLVPSLGWCETTVFKIEVGSRRLLASELLALWDHGLVRLADLVDVRSDQTPRVSSAAVRVGRSRGVRAEEIERMSLALWGRSFAAERDGRLQTGGFPLSRGRRASVSRQLLEEIHLA